MNEPKFRCNLFLASLRHCSLQKMHKNLKPPINYVIKTIYFRRHKQTFWMKWDRRFHSWVSPSWSSSSHINSPSMLQSYLQKDLMALFSILTKVRENREQTVWFTSFKVLFQFSPLDFTIFTYISWFRLAFYFSQVLQIYMSSWR